MSDAKVGVAALFGMAWMLGVSFASGGFPEPLSIGYAVQFAVGSTLVATLWLVAMRPAVAAADSAKRLLAAAVDWLPEQQRQWGYAMLAELAHVPGRVERWRFAAGCAAVLVLRRQPAPQPVIAVAGLVGVLACWAAVVHFVIQVPSAGVQPAVVVPLAVVLAALGWLTLAAARRDAADSDSRRIAAGAAIVVGVGVVTASRLGISNPAMIDEGIVIYLMLGPPVIFFATSLLAARHGRSRRAGVQAAVWAAVLGTLAVFAVGMFEAVHWYQADARLIFAGDRAPGAAGENLRGFACGLLLLPVWWLPFGLLGAAAGGMRRTAVTGPSVS